MTFWRLASFAVLCSAGAHAEPPAPLELLFTGDVNFSGRAAPAPAAVRDRANPLAAFAPRFEKADVVFCNGEGLLTNAPPAQYREDRLNITAAPMWAAAYAAAFVDVVSLANNHSWDGGREGVVENRSHHVNAGVAVIGAADTRDDAEAPHRIMHADGRCRVSVLPATLKSNRPPRTGAAVAYYVGDEGLDALEARIRGERQRGCLVIVSVHWGREAVHEPPAPVVAAAHRIVDAGAQVVVGHHPHVLQGVERRGDAVIVYSLGNFVFVNRAPEKRRTGVLSVRLSPDDALSEVALLPGVIHPSRFTPEPATAEQRQDLVSRLSEYSSRFGVVAVETGDRITFETDR
jgi:poly-gamma-glutamate capsule biosynthesis protein CapA/YwtB (metallophosphatase superfamily)